MKIQSLTTCLCLAISLTGCGGGGSGSNIGGIGATGNTTGTTTTPPTGTGSGPVVTPIDDTALQLAVPTPVYQDPQALLAYQTLDAARRAFGVGALSQELRVDMAAGNHAHYIITKFGLGHYLAATHTEDPAQPGFTGVAATDRVRFVGFSAPSTSENLTDVIQVDGVTGNDPGQVSVLGLLGGPYHRAVFFSPAMAVGIGHDSIRLAGTGGMNHVFVYDLVVPQGKGGQLPARDWVGVWPLDGASEVLYQFGSEVPDPLPENHGKCGGYPVSVQVRDGQVLSTQALTLKETVSGIDVPMRVATKETDANPAFAQANSMYGIPYRPLNLGTLYTAHFVGSNNGVAIDKTWSFRTTSRNLRLVYGCDPL